MRLIDGNALMDLYANRLELLGERYGLDSSECGVLAGAMKLLEAQPTIEERKTGKWIEVEDFYNRIRGRCSVCGWEAHMYEDDVVGMDYCPNCGAKMEGTE